MSKSLADENRSRDVRRRIEVIHKKLADLQELGIPCAFCYSSARNTGSIFTLGDLRITDVIERHKNEILVNLSGDNSDQGEGSKTEIHLILPPLPSPLEKLNRHTLQSMIVGIIKDLGLKWSDYTPSWWPEDIPFVQPRSLPQKYCGEYTSLYCICQEFVYVIHYVTFLHAQLSSAIYRIAGKFGGDLNLALWRSGSRSSILH